eukprot:9769243-Alexandrium_andersonii.AAC.1
MAARRSAASLRISAVEIRPFGSLAKGSSRGTLEASAGCRSCCPGCCGPCASGPYPGSHRAGEGVSLPQGLQPMLSSHERR